MTSALAKQYIEKTLKYVKSLKTDKINVYTSTKHRLTEISKICTEIISINNSILNVDSDYTSPDKESEPVCTPISSSDYDSLCERLDYLESRIDILTGHNLSNHDDEQVVADTCISEDLITSDLMKSNVSENLIIDVKSIESPTENITANSTTESVEIKSETNTRTQINPSDARLLVHKYAVSLESATKESHDNEVLDKCAKLLWLWYKQKIIYKPKMFKRQRFDIRNLDKYLTSILIICAYHIRQNDFNEFCKDFLHQLDLVDSDPNATSVYLLPYEAFQVYKGDNSYFTPNVIHLWELLFDTIYNGTEIHKFYNSLYHRMLDDNNIKGGQALNEYQEIFESTQDPNSAFNIL